MSEFRDWADELSGAQLVGRRWVRPARPFSWVAAIAIAVLAGPGLFAGALFLTQAIAGAHR